MKINDLSNCKNGEYVKFKGVIIGRDESITANGGKMLSLKLGDNTGYIKTPVFDMQLIDEINELNPATPVTVFANINIWNGNIQLKNIEIEVLKDDEYAITDFINSYNISEKESNEINNIISQLKEPYRSVAKNALSMNASGFFTAPAAEKHHGNRLHGLVLHTLGVLKVIDSIVNLYDGYQNIDIENYINVDRLKLKAVLHDMEKRSEYKYDVAISRKPDVIGHIVDGVTTLIMANNLCSEKLTEEDLENIKYGILSHHGEYGPYQPKTTEDIILHLADMIDSRMVGEIDKFL